MNRSLQNNIRTIYAMGFFHSFIVVVPVFVPLLQGYGLSMNQVLQTQALFALTIALCEVPSGYIADLSGRRPAILFGSALNALGFFSLLWADSFYDFLIYEALLGVGFSLISGADLALVEVPRPQGPAAHRDNARRILDLLLFGKPVVFWTAFAIAVFGLLALYVFWIYQKYWESQGVPLSWFGYIWAAFALTVSLAARYTAALEQRFGTRTMLYLIAGLPLLGMAIDSRGVENTLLVLLAIFAPLMGLVLVPLVMRIRREAVQDAQQPVTAG